GSSSISTHLIEETDGNPPSPPINKTVLCLLAEIKTDALGINRVFRPDADHVPQLVHEEVVGEGRETFAVTLRDFRLSEAIARQLHSQADRNAVSRAFLRLGLFLNNAVRGRTDHRIDFRRLDCFVSEFSPPKLSCQGVIYAV